MNPSNRAHACRCSPLGRTVSGGWLVCALVVATLATGAVHAEDSATSRPAPEVSEQALLATLGANFDVRRTPHFVVAYDGDVESLQVFISRLEATYRSVIGFLRVCDISYKEPVERLEVVFFARYREFHAFAARQGTDSTGMAGFYDRAQNRAFFYDAVTAPRLDDVKQRIDTLIETLRRRSLSGTAHENAVRELSQLRVRRDQIIDLINRLVVQHEVAHQVLFNTGVHVSGADNPTWLVEGLACLFETPPTDYGAGLAVANPYRLLNFREALVGSDDERAVRAASVEDFRRAVAAGRLGSIRELVTRRALFDTATATVENIYAEAWALTFYLQRQRRDDLAVYLTVIARRPGDRRYSPEQEWLLFEETFGPVDEAFERQWVEYILRHRVRTQ